MEFDRLDEFEEELQASMRRVAAPAKLKRVVMERHAKESVQRRRHQRMLWFERIAATLVLGAVAGGALYWRDTIERQEGEAARKQVFTALQIANRALEQMSEQLRERDSSE